MDPILAGPFLDVDLDVDLDSVKRYGKRLVTSIPERVEKAIGVGLNPIGSAEEFTEQAKSIFHSLTTKPVGPQVKDYLMDAFTSPERAADATLDLASLLITRKFPKVFGATRADETAIGALAAHQIFADPPATHYTPGEHIREALDLRDAGFLKANEARANPPIDLNNIPGEPYGIKVPQTSTRQAAAVGTRKSLPPVHFDMSKLKTNKNLP